MALHTVPYEPLPITSKMVYRLASPYSCAAWRECREIGGRSMQQRTVKKSAAVVADGVAISVKSLRCVGARAVDYARSTATTTLARAGKSAARRFTAFVQEQSAAAEVKSLG